MANVDGKMATGREARVSRPRIVALLLAFAAAVAAWWATRSDERPRPPESVGGAEAGPAVGAPIEGDLVRGRALEGALPAPPPSVAPPPGLRSDEGGDVRTRSGRVVDAQGHPVSGATVSWVAVVVHVSRAGPPTPAPPPRMLGEARTDANGFFAIECAAGDPPPELTRLCIALAGRESTWVDARAGTVAVVLPADLVPLRGRVVDPDGRPVPDLDLRLTDAWLSDQYVPIDLAMRPSDAGRTADEARFVATRTDAEGRFEVHVRNSLGLHAVSASPAWFVRADTHDALPRGLPEELLYVTLYATPAVTLRASVRDARSGTAIDRFEGHAHDADGSTFVAFDGRDGALAIAWPRWWKADERRTIEVDVESEGYAPARTVVVYEPGATDARTDVRLAPATPDARADVTFDVRDSNGGAFDGDWVVRIVDPKDADKTVMTLTLTRVGAGLYRAQVPEGEWTILVKTGEGLGYLRRVLALDVRGAAAQSLRCDMPPHGSLRLVWPASATPRAENGSTDPVLIVRRPAERIGSAVTLRFGTSSYRAPALPEGDFEVALYPAGLSGTPWRKTARIVAGTETTLELGTR